MGHPRVLLVVQTLGWLKERWFDFRNGHNVYGGMVLQFINFVLLVKVAFNLSAPLVALLLLTTYLPMMIMVGFYYHRKRQLKTDNDANFRQFPLGAKIWRVMYFGTEEEKQKMKELLLSIENS